VASPIVSTGSVELVLVELVMVPGVVDPVAGVVVPGAGEAAAGVVGVVGAGEVAAGVVVVLESVPAAEQPALVVEDDDVVVELVVPTGGAGTVGVVELLELELDDVVDPD
jgi:hypothetical protein